MHHHFVADRSAIWRRHIPQLIVVAALIAGLACAGLLAPLAHAATISVNTTTDEVNADGHTHADAHAHTYTDGNSFANAHVYA